MDDIIVKSNNVYNHIDDMRKVFFKCRLYNLRMNPLKCAFGCSFKEIFRVLVHRKGIDLDPAKAIKIWNVPRIVSI